MSDSREILLDVLAPEGAVLAAGAAEGKRDDRGLASCVGRQGQMFAGERLPGDLGQDVAGVEGCLGLRR
jgi:hypothetical protein